jgi:hypothetical protein
MGDDGFISRHIASLERLIADLRQLKRETDVIGLLCDGDGLSVEHVAYALECTDETVRKKCEASASTNCPLGFKFPKCWIIGKTRLLDSVEKEEGTHARLVVEDRLKEYVPKLRANAIRREPKHSIANADHAHRRAKNCEILGHAKKNRV